MFELKTTTECELTKFVGRTQKGGKEDVPAVSVYLKISSASNTMLDMLSPTMRLMAYAPIEGQAQLPDVELVTPVLRSTDLKHWKSETIHEGWRVFLSRGAGDGAGLQMGSCKIDEFAFDLYQGGHVDCEFRISTADVDEAGAGMLWGRQKRKVFVQIHAPELPPPASGTEATGAAIDGTVGHPGAAAQEAGDLFAAEHGGASEADGEDHGTFEVEFGGESVPPDDDDGADGEGSTPDLEQTLEQALPEPEKPKRGKAKSATEEFIARNTPAH